MPEAETVRSEGPVHPRGASHQGGYGDFPTGSYAEGPSHADDDYDKSGPTFGSVPATVSVYKTRPRAAPLTDHRSQYSDDDILGTGTVTAAFDATAAATTEEAASSRAPPQSTQPDAYACGPVVIECMNAVAPAFGFVNREQARASGARRDGEARRPACLSGRMDECGGAAGPTSGGEAHGGRGVA